MSDKLKSKHFILFQPILSTQFDITFTFLYYRRR